MDQLVQQAVEFVLALRGPLAYGLVGFFAWAEAAFFLGLITPGELAIATGGMLASRGQLELGGVAAVAVAGTVLGNTTGYLLGRTWGPDVEAWGPFERFLGPSFDSAHEFFERRGSWAIVVGTFVSYVRIFVPFVAGSSGMPVRRFLAFGVPAAAVWATAWALFGFLLGESWRVLQDMAGAAAFLVLGLFLLAVAIRWVAGWIARRRERVTAWGRRLLEAPPLVWIRRPVGAMARWLGRRFAPRVAGSLTLTAGFVTLLVGAGAVGLVLSQVESVRGIALIDFPVLEWMAATRTDTAVRVARVGLQPFLVPGLLATTLLVALVTWWRRGWPTAARSTVGLLGSGLGAHLLDRYALQAVVPGTEFPAVPVAVAAALLVHVTAAVGARHDWGRTVATAATGVFLACTVALATVVAGWAAPSGVVLGFALGLTWSTSLELPGRFA